jgi:DNA modification methylase
MKKKTLIWRTERRKISDLVPNALNPRMMSPKQVEDLKKSLERFNLVEIPVIDTENRVIAGHQRLAVMKLLGRGEETIDVRVPSRKLSKKEYDAYLLASNRIHGDWDWEKLSENFDIDLLLASGFDDADLGHIWDENLSVEDDEFDIDKELEKIKVPKTKMGEAYQLGSHLLLCGDSEDGNLVRKLVGAVKVSMLYFDPPYNISLDYDTGVSGKKRYGGTVDDSKPDADYKAFLKKVIENGLDIAYPDTHVFLWCDQRYIGLVQEIYKELSIENKRVCLWVKNAANPTPGVAFNKCYEPCVYGVRGKPYLSEKVTNLNEILNKEIGTGNRAIDDILDMLDIWLVKRITGSEYEHPTQKPPSLHEKALRRCTKPGDIVLDLFGGSGSTMIACEQLKRRCLTVEQEPIFCDIILKRYEKLTGKKAVKVG